MGVNETLSNLRSREAWLFQDIGYGQWGLHILGPVAAAARTNAERVM